MSTVLVAIIATACAFVVTFLAFFGIALLNRYNSVRNSQAELAERVEESSAVSTTHTTITTDSARGNVNS